MKAIFKAVLGGIMFLAPHAAMAQALTPTELSLLAQRCMLAKDYDFAMEYCTNALNSGEFSIPNQVAMLHLGRGRAYLNHGQYAEAVADLEEAVRLYPNESNISSLAKARAGLAQANGAAAPKQAAPQTRIAALPAQPRAVAPLPQESQTAIASVRPAQPQQEVNAATGKSSFPIPDNNECLTLDPNPENPFSKSSTIVGFVNNCGMPINWHVCMFNERLARWECGSGTAENGEHFNRRIQLSDTPGTARWLKAGCSQASVKASSGGNCGGDPNSLNSGFGAGH